MDIKPISLKQANDFVEINHRHHRKTAGHKWSIGCYSDERLIGVTIVGRPLSRYFDDGKTVEVLRLCTDGTYNACSKLYSRCARIAKDMGYTKIITYILENETGTSLKASGWVCEDSSCGGGSWLNCKRRENERHEVQLSLFDEKPLYPIEKKQRWSKSLN